MMSTFTLYIVYETWMKQAIVHHKVRWLKYLQRKGSKEFYKVMPAKREHLSVLTATNTSGEIIPNYYIFTGMRKLKNYVIKCEDGALQGL